MKKYSLVLSLILLLVSSVFTQDTQEKIVDKKDEEKPDFSGTWILNEDESYANSKYKEKIQDYVIIIDHSGDEVKIRRSYVENDNKNSYTETIYTDKRGESNLDKSGVTGNPEIKSKTLWKKNSILRRFQYNKSAAGLPVYIVSSEKYSLSEDGKVLTIKTDFIHGPQTNPYMQDTLRRNSYSTPKLKLVFDKKE